jgi:protein translocase SecG subunit
MNTIANLLPYIQLFLALLLVIIIVLQRSGDGIEGALGGTASTMTQSARRGGEKVMFYITIIIAILFVASAIIGILLSA